MSQSTLADRSGPRNATKIIPHTLTCKRVGRKGHLGERQRQGERQTSRQADRLADRQKDGQRDRKSKRQRDRA